MTLFIAVYLIALCCYLITRMGEKILYRAINKYVMATMYLVFAIVVFVKKGQFVSYQTLLIAALIFAWLGDVFLVFDFGRGGDFFLACNVCFILYEQVVLVDHGYRFRDFAWVFVAAGIILLAFVLACQYKPEKFKLGKMRWPMTFYLASIITHGITGLAMILLLPGTNYAMMGAGSMLFMISDMLLTTYKYVFDKKWLVRANSVTYFIGMLLIVLSTV